MSNIKRKEKWIKTDFPKYIDFDFMQILALTVSEYLTFPHNG